MSKRPSKIVFWVLRIVSAVILLQTLFFKFTAAEESVYVFSKLGIEPWGRIGSGVMELIAAILILIPATTGIGALIALGVISGALVSHLTVLGIEVKGDGLTVQRPFVNALNVTINLGYRFSPKFSAGFNIDLIGATFGQKSSSVLQSNGRTSTDATSKPTAFNLLLTGDHDQGSLNSEFFLKYQINDKWGVRAVYQFLFTEYTTGSVRQTAADGTVIDRFRNKANNFGAGISYSF